MDSAILARAASEAGGTALLVALGTGSVVESVRTGQVPLLVLAAAWFVAVLLPMGLFIRRSGAHLNPAITLALAASGRIAWREVPPYVLGQVAGAFLGSGAVWVVLGPVGHLGATVPTHGDTLMAFPAELAFTAGLVAAVFALSDRGEGFLRWRLVLPPTVVALATYFIGPWTGSSLNPARTLAPAILSATYTDLWVYFTAVPIGALVVAAAWRPRSVDRLDRGPGRPRTST